MLDNGLITMRSSSADCMIFNLDDSLLPGYMMLAEELRKEGIECDVTLSKKKIGAQFKLAEKKGLTWVIIAGESELQQKKYNIKNIQTGEEQQGAGVAEILEVLRDSDAG